MLLLSVIIPVYNTKEYLIECLDSVVRQNNGSIEVILVDDGSTDGSDQICDDYAGRYSGFIRVIHKANQGLLLARRTGIAAAHGDYIAHLDSDDYLLDGAIQSICDAIKDNPCDMAFFDYIYGAGQGKPERIIKIRSEEKNTFINNKSEIIDKFLFRGHFSSIWIKVARRDIVDTENEYLEFAHVANGEDVLQSLALIDRSNSFLYIPRALYFYRRDNISMSKTYKTKDYDSFKTVHEETLKYGKKWGLSEEQFIELKLRMLSKNMVILHQVRKNSPEKAYNCLLKTMSIDPYFLNLKDALKSKNISKYYRVLFILISKKMIVPAKAFINLVQRR